MPNHLISETSPYLLQHAHNPVDWYPWGPEALAKVLHEQKLLVISIGYAACHWCHVMEHESFEDPTVAELMNRYFVSIKVDREERPDIDQLYMNAAYLITGRGGWPLNVIALPDQKPVFAGTYFPKANWIQVLRHFAMLFEKNHDSLDQQAAEVMREVKALQRAPGAESELNRDPGVLEGIYASVEDQLDFENGGMRGAPKFPMPSLLSYLMKFAFLADDSKVRDYVMQSLKKMSCGGIYDQLGGGFCRYSVDAQWKIPHFEKMLYDNAQLVALYSDAFRWSGEAWIREVVVDTLEFIQRELTSPGGLFFSSLDADSDGEEGAYYSWTAEEIRQVNGIDPEPVMNHLGISVAGNWERGKNILFLAAEGNTEAEGRRLRKARTLLLREREKRSRPATDYKILTAWNALMIKGFVSAFRAFGKPEYMESAVKAASFFAARVDEGKGQIHRNYTRGMATIPGFLDDYAFLGSAFLDLYESTFDPRWLMLSENLAGQVLERFADPVSGLFRYTSVAPGELTGQVIETSDNVIPASNSELSSLLFRLGLVTGNGEFSAKSLSLLKKMYRQILHNPAYHSNWCSLLADYLYPPAEVAITGPGFPGPLKEIHGQYLPGTVFYGGTGDIFPGTLKGKVHPGKTLIYVCRDKTCLSPVETASDALSLIIGNKPGI